MLVVAFVALAVFAGCCFWVQKCAERVRTSLEQRHPAELREISPAASADWTKHWAWQNAANVAWAAMPLIDRLDDAALARDVAQFRLAVFVSFAAWAATIVSFWIAT